MKIKTTPFYLFFIASFVTIMGVILKSDLLLLITKPIIIPSIYFYYISCVRKPNLLFVLFLVSNFIGDSVVMLRLDNFLFTMVPYFISYLLIIKLVIENISVIEINYKAVGYCTIIFAFLVYILSLLIDLQSENRQTLVVPIIIYGILLAFLAIFSVYNYLTFKTISGLYLLFACACALLSDVFFLLYNLHFHIPVLNLINSITQLLSYFFFAKYMIHRKERAIGK